MSYSRTLQWNGRQVKMENIIFFRPFHSFPKCHRSSKIPSHKSLLNPEPEYHGKPLLFTFRERYSFKFPRKPLPPTSPAFGGEFHSKFNSTLGSIENNGPLTKSQANDLVLRLTEDERQTLLSALQEYQSNQVKSEYEAEKVPPPTGNQLIHVAFFNAVPFVGFGFLDNFIMICAGDYIDETLGSMIAISTMAAAALGNTVSDVMGIGSAWYVELAASKIGLKPPNLSPIQLDMKGARRAANLGRALGIVVGCLLGMIPLLFFPSKESHDKHELEKK